ncbi:DUF6478 family protein [Thalassorhabdomicrobium marinisediminis]|uniref:Uncharacterized protein n=1 Tax=Thalassorhabdomicrobium marinisediminis TaxID=2170577 RepID=A0A2T7FVW4_9RHOB|nr:DUF6478 family protein [Thalassorhabdomicrobium marinisediminis]PVA06301.1 hypothetical protein DC363_10360 [Thalassorhabdomicrobium marinisediminis]
MGKHSAGLLEKVLLRRTRAFWSRAARQAATVDLSVLRQQRTEARILRHKLDELTYHADNRLALPRIGSTSFPKPAGTDWSWRPQLWRGALPFKGLSAVESKTRLGDEATIFHDCQISELSLRQLRNTREADLAPYGLRMDVFRFDGSFLSLVLDLPQSATDGLLKRHLVRMEAIVEVEKPLEIFARLNVRHGPNTEQIVRELPLYDDKVMVEFDLAYTKLNEKRVEAIWVDLIFEGPEMNQVTLRDVTFSRNPRAEL